MKPKRIILVRHGYSEGQADPTSYARIPDHRIQLTHRGEQQAAVCGHEIRQLLMDGTGNVSLITYCSPHLRSVQTFDRMDAGAFGVLRRDPWLSRDRKVYEDPRLREQEWGNFRTVEETERIQKERYAYGPFYYRFPHGESCADVYDRVSSFLETMHRDFDDQDYPENALIVSHGMTIRLFIMRWFHISVKEFESWANPSNCQRLIMEMGKDGRYVMPKMELGEMGG